MKRLTAISTLFTSLLFPLAIPAIAQHGGGHGGFSGHSGGGSGFRGGVHSGPSGFAPRAGFVGARPGTVRSGTMRPGSPMQNRAGMASRSFAGPGMQTTVSPYRQAYHSPNDPENRRWNRGGVIYERPRGRRNSYIAPYFWGYPYGLGYYGGDGYYDDSFNDNPDQSGYAQTGYDQSSQTDNQNGSYQDPNYGPGQYNGFDPQAPGPDQMQGSYQIQGENQYGEQADVQSPYPVQYPNQIPPGAPYQPWPGAQPSSSNARSAARPAYRPSRTVPNQPAVTLVFKDNRPNQIIHNYLVNGETLTVWDQSAHDISVDDLNVEATQKINRDKGVDFYLPGATQ